jgi:hypothetical protein
MNDANTPPAPPADPTPGLKDQTHLSRLRTLTDLVVFQFKLALDGLRDLLLSPVAIVAAIAGLIAGGDRPDRYLREVLRFGLKTERWINLFGEYDGPGTADHLVDPLRERVMGEAQDNPWLNKAGTHLNRQLDQVNSALAKAGPSGAGAGASRSAPQGPGTAADDPTRAPD